MVLWIFLLSAALADSPFEDDLDVTLRSSDATAVVYEYRGATLTLRRTPGPDEPRSTARCSGGGADLFVDGAVDEAFVERACGRLPVHAPHFAQPQQVAPTVDPPKSVLPFDPMRSIMEALAVVWFAAMALAAPRARAPWIWFAAAVATRAALGAPLVLMGKAYPYMHLMGYTGTIAASPLYGHGWFAVMSSVRTVLGSNPDRLHFANLIFSSLTVPWLWAVMNAWTGDRRIAHASALLLTVLPLAITLSGSEVFFVLCALLEVTAVAGALRRDLVGDALAVSSAALLAHARPDQIPFVAAFALFLWAQRRRPAVALLTVAVAARVWAIGVPNGHDGFPNPSPDAFAPSTLLKQWWGAGSSLALPDPWVHPFWLLPAVVFGWSRAAPAVRRPLLFAALAATLPYAHMYFATDVLRFQLPAATWWVALASLAAPTLMKQSRIIQFSSAIVAALGLALARHPGGDLATRTEYGFLRDNLPKLPANSVLRYDKLWDDDQSFKDWAERIAPIQAVPLAGGEHPSSGELLFLGLAGEIAARDVSHPAPAVEACEGDTLAERAVAPESGGLLHFKHPDAPIELKLVRVRDCGAHQATTEPPITPPPPAP